MKQKTWFLVILVIVLSVAGLGYFFAAPKDQPIPLSPEAAKAAKPSETFIEYTDPAGFRFNYPDNLSIEKNEEMDSSTYADLQLFSKDVSGSLAIRITDTKLKNINDWVKEASSSNAPVEKSLGNLKAMEVKTGDRLMLGAIDQGVLFSIEVPLLEQDFWMKVYDRVLSDFSFVAPETAATGAVSTASEDEVVFESEEVVE